MACASSGLAVRPPELAAWTKKRFGQVGPGTDAYQKLHTANSLATVASTGIWLGVKYSITRWASCGVCAAACALRTNPDIGAGVTGGWGSRVPPACNP